MSNITVVFRRPFLPGLFFLILILLVTSPLYTQPYTVVLLTNILMYVVLTVSWAIFSGSTGYISLASASFFGVGLYTSAIMGPTLPLLITIAIGGLISSLLAFLVGALTLRLRGIYFAMFTFGLVELMRHLIRWWEINVTGTTGRVVFTVDSTTVYYVMLAIFMMALLTAYLIRGSRFGLALRSINEYEEAAAHMGINVDMVKTITFAISAFFMGATGAIMATRWTYIDPAIAFNVILSFMPVLMAIFGGMAQLYGPVVGAAILAYLEEVLISEFPYHSMLLMGIILVGAIVYFPHGLIGVMQKWRKGIFRKKYENT